MGGHFKKAIIFTAFLGLAPQASATDFEPLHCPSFYTDDLGQEPNGNSITVSIFVGHLDMMREKGVVDYAPEFISWLITRMSRSCAPDIPSGFCDFRPVEGAPRTFTKPQYGTEFSIDVILRPVAPPPSGAFVPGAKGREWLEEIERSILNDSATFVVSHSRHGAGPDPFPEPGGINWLYRRYVLDPFSYILNGLKKRTRPHVLGLNLCDAEKYYGPRLLPFASKGVQPIVVMAKEKAYDLQYHEIMQLIEFVVGGFSLSLCPDQIKAKYLKQNAVDQYIWAPTEMWEPQAQ